MLGYISGKVIHTKSGKIIVKIPSGVGYFVNVSPVTSFMVNDHIELFILESTKDDTTELYGFVEIEDREFVDQLTKVSGVGPKMAANILYSIGSKKLQEAIRESDHETISSQVRGLGSKTAKKIILELKGAITDLNILEDSSRTTQIAIDFADTLTNLGYKRGDIVAVISKLKKSGSWDEANITSTIKAGLKLLSK